MHSFHFNNSVIQKKQNKSSVFRIIPRMIITEMEISALRSIKKIITLIFLILSIEFKDRIMKNV